MKKIYFIVFFVFILCFVILAVIYANNTEFTANINNVTTVLLATIGFLFAFAGINIYSIFNTNIEEEKKRLHDLQRQYEDEFKFAKAQWKYSQKMITYYQTCQMIIDSHTFNPQIYDWIFDLHRYIKDFKAFLKGLHDQKRETHYVSFKRDFLNLSRGVNIQLAAFSERIQESSTSFFKGVTANDKKNFLEVLQDVILETDVLREYDFTEETKKSNISKDSDPLSVKLKKVWISIKNVFYS